MYTHVHFWIKGIRSIYSADFIGIGTFQRHCQATQRNANSQIGKKKFKCKYLSKKIIFTSKIVLKQLENIKKNLQETLAKPDGKIFVEDLKTALYCTKTDEDLDLVKNSIER